MPAFSRVTDIHVKVIAYLENMEMSGNLAVVREMLGNSQKNQGIVE